MAVDESDSFALPPYLHCLFRGIDVERAGLASKIAAADQAVAIRSPRAMDMIVHIIQDIRDGKASGRIKTDWMDEIISGLIAHTIMLAVEQQDPTPGDEKIHHAFRAYGEDELAELWNQDPAELERRIIVAVRAVWPPGARAFDEELPRAMEESKDETEENAEGRDHDHDHHGHHH